MIAPSLTTERLSIEPMSLAHWEDYAATWADPRMTEFIGGDPRNRNLSWGKMLQGIGLWSLFGYGYWSFVERASGKFVGNGGLAQFERGIPELEGYPEAGWAFAADAWGKGYATEAMTEVGGMEEESRCGYRHHEHARCQLRRHRWRRIRLSWNRDSQPAARSATSARAT